MKTNRFSSIHFGSYRLQFYWPQVCIRTKPIKEFYVSFETVFRFLIDNRSDKYWGVGLQLFGFGIGIDNENKFK
jgi:hypothetical protein